MTDYVLEIAKDMGIKKIIASVLQSNRVMVNMFFKRGFTKVEDEYGEYLMELDLEKVLELS